MTFTHLTTLLLLLCIATIAQTSFASRKLTALFVEKPVPMKYHNGPLLKGNVTVNLIWYGKFTPTQRSIIVDYVNSISSGRGVLSPSVSTWWKTTEKYEYGRGAGATISVGKQILDEKYSVGKSLKNAHIILLASQVSKVRSVNVVLTAIDVTVEGFCMSRCGSHGSTRGKTRFSYAWVGNSETQCPGQCAWPFHQPIYGPQTPPLIAPNGDVGIDGMIINLATVLAGAVTNPFNNGYFQGPATAPLEAVTACTGVFGSGAYPGYAGNVLVDKSSGSSYNAYGVNGRKYLVPAMWDSKTSTCSTLV